MNKTILFFTLITLVAFSSCTKDGSDKENFDKEKWENKEDWEKDKDDKACFELVYPVTFIMPDGSAVTVNDEKDAAVKDWYKTNDSKEKSELQYPVDIIYEDDGVSKTVTIPNEDKMIAAKKKCYDEEWKKEKCFDLVYPVTFAMPDGSAITVNDEKDAAIKDWYKTNPDVKEKPELQYPVDIIYEDDGISKTVTIPNEDKMIDAKKDCEG